MDLAIVEFDNEEERSESSSMNNNNKRLLVAIVLLLLVCLPMGVSARRGPQGPGHWPGGAPSDAVPAVIPDLTDEQRVALAHIEQVYGSQMNQLQGKLMGKRLELQVLFGDPRADETIIRAKAGELFELYRECQQAKVDYQLAVRGILTPEQLRAWCSSREGCVARGWMREP
jgi:Spy/CpxP family protein refolding chaperone